MLIIDSALCVASRSPDGQAYFLIYQSCLMHYHATARSAALHPQPAAAHRASLRTPAFSSCGSLLIRLSRCYWDRRCTDFNPANTRSTPNLSAQIAEQFSHRHVGSKDSHRADSITADAPEILYKLPQAGLCHELELHAASLQADLIRHAEEASAAMQSFSDSPITKAGTFIMHLDACLGELDEMRDVAGFIGRIAIPAAATLAASAQEDGSQPLPDGKGTIEVATERIYDMARQAGQVLHCTARAQTVILEHPAVNAALLRDCSDLSRIPAGMNNLVNCASPRVMPPTASPQSPTQHSTHGANPPDTSACMPATDVPLAEVRAAGEALCLRLFRDGYHPSHAAAANFSVALSREDRLQLWHDAVWKEQQLTRSLVGVLLADEQCPEVEVEQEELQHDPMLHRLLQLQQDGRHHPTDQGALLVGRGVTAGSTHEFAGVLDTVADAAHHDSHGMRASSADSGDSGSADGMLCVGTPAASNGAMGGGTLRLDLGVVQHLLTHHTDDGVRQLAFEAGVLQRCEEVLDGMDHLQQQRLQLARCFGAQTYADVALAGTLAGDSTTSASFLVELAEALKPFAEREVDTLHQRMPGLTAWQLDFAKQAATLGSGEASGTSSTAAAAADTTSGGPGVGLEADAAPVFPQPVDAVAHWSPVLQGAPCPARLLEGLSEVLDELMGVRLVRLHTGPVPLMGQGHSLQPAAQTRQSSSGCCSEQPQTQLQQPNATPPPPAPLPRPLLLAEADTTPAQHQLEQKPLGPASLSWLASGLTEVMQAHEVVSSVAKDSAAPGQDRLLVYEVHHESWGRAGTLLVDCEAGFGTRYVLAGPPAGTAMPMAVTAEKAMGRRVDGSAIAGAPHSTNACTSASGDADALVASATACGGLASDAEGSTASAARPTDSSKCTFGSAAGQLQVPIVAVGLQSHGMAAQQPAFIVWQLCHEMGHALHLLLSARGARAYHSRATHLPLELLELPSCLLERLASHPPTLARILAGGDGGHHSQSSLQPAAPCSGAASHRQDPGLGTALATAATATTHADTSHSACPHSSAPHQLAGCVAGPGPSAVSCLEQAPRHVPAPRRDAARAVHHMHHRQLAAAVDASYFSPLGLQVQTCTALLDQLLCGAPRRRHVPAGQLWHQLLGSFLPSLPGPFTCQQALSLSRVITARGQGYAYVVAWYLASIVWEQWLLQQQQSQHQNLQHQTSSVNHAGQLFRDAAGAALPCGMFGRALRGCLYERGNQMPLSQLLADILGNDARTGHALIDKHTGASRVGGGQGVVLRVDRAAVKRWFGGQED